MQDITQAALQASNVEKILDWLCPPCLHHVFQGRGDFEPCQWIFNTEEYRRWVSRNSKGPLWIFGIPGCGKSVLANYLSENAKSGMTLTYFFQCSTDAESTKPSTMIASVLWQITRFQSLHNKMHVETLIPILLPLHDAYGSYQECPFNRLLSAFIITTQGLMDLTLIVDGLDECHHREDLTILLRQLVVISRRPQTNVILLSRYPEAFEMSVPDATHLRITAQMVSSNILHFARHEIIRKPRLKSIEDQILAKVSKEAGEMFLWVRMMLEYLVKAPTPNSQLERLSKFPSGLTEIYEQFLVATALSLEPEEVETRNDIFLLILSAIRPLSIDEISAALAAKSTQQNVDPRDLFFEPEEEILRLCWPLVTVIHGRAQLIHASVKEYLLRFAEPVTKGSVRFTQQNCHDFILHKCLLVLNQERATSKMVCSLLVKRNVGVEQSIGFAKDLLEGLSSFYEYSSLHWHRYLSPGVCTQEQVDLINQFMTNSQFVVWVESVFMLKGGFNMGPILVARGNISEWYHSLIPRSKEMIPLQSFFSHAYSVLLSEYRNCQQECLMQYLILHRLGTYYNLTCEQLSTLYNIRREIADGCKQLLGERHPFTFRALTDFCIERFSVLELQKAEHDLQYAMQKQKELLDTDIYDSFYTQSYLGATQLHQMKFHESKINQAQASEGLLRILGPTNKEYLKSRLFLAWSLEAQGYLKDALVINQDIWNKWVPVHSAEDPLSMMSQMSMAILLRKLKIFEQAEQNMLEVFANRRRIFGEANSMTLDTAINLAFLYRDMDKEDKSRELIERIKSTRMEGCDFERICQVRHLEALLSLDGGHGTVCRKILEDTLHEAVDKEQNNNRELLWMRLTLAKVLHSLHDSGSYRLLFLGLTTSSDIRYDCTDGKIVEKALRSVKDNQMDAAVDLLDSHGMRWTRKEDFWIPTGGPMAGSF